MPWLPGKGFPGLKEDLDLKFNKMCPILIQKGLILYNNLYKIVTIIETEAGFFKDNKFLITSLKSLSVGSTDVVK